MLRKRTRKLGLVTDHSLNIYGAPGSLPSMGRDLKKKERQKSTINNSSPWRDWKRSRQWSEMSQEDIWPDWTCSLEQNRLGLAKRWHRMGQNGLKGCSYFMFLLFHLSFNTRKKVIPQSLHCWQNGLTSPRWPHVSVFSPGSKTMVWTTHPQYKFSCSNLCLSWWWPPDWTGSVSLWFRVSVLLSGWSWQRPRLISSRKGS